MSKRFKWLAKDSMSLFGLHRTLNYQGIGLTDCVKQYDESESRLSYSYSLLKAIPSMMLELGCVARLLTTGLVWRGWARRVLWFKVMHMLKT
ncbi:hypothetical protein V6N11_041830 [Hibiscus sabdariffa]|uniref:Uncharacterized protein n=1 Tax=Hibiscus sabdariffa TaxID=183260 RepID=A0ABR2RMC2_9ROSI